MGQKQPSIKSALKRKNSEKYDFKPKTAELIKYIKMTNKVFRTKTVSKFNPV
jgi:hypothetical protein